MPVSTLARTHARLGKSHDLPRESLSRDHGKLLCVFHQSRFLDRLLEVCISGKPELRNVFLPRSEHVTKVASFAVHCLDLVRGLRMPLKKHCCAISTFCSRTLS